MAELWGQDDQRWADVGHIADALRRYFKNRAYTYTGGTDGCALCKDRGLVERVAAGHIDCAREGVAWDAVQGYASNLSDFDLNIAVARAIDDPRLFQYLQAASEDGPS